MKQKIRFIILTGFVLVPHVFPDTNVLRKKGTSTGCTHAGRLHGACTLSAASARSCCVGVLFILCFLGGCGSKIKLPDDPKVYEQGQNEEEGYAYLAYEDKIFVPYCPYDSKYLGECIGYCDISDLESGKTERIYICELKGYSPDEWIIDFLDINCSEGMILREINAVDIPDGLDSEYVWNAAVN